MIILVRDKKFRYIRYVYNLIDTDKKAYLSNHPDFSKVNDSLLEYMRSIGRDNRTRNGYGFPINIEGNGNIG